MSRRRALFTEADLNRAIRAAERSPTPRAIEVAPDGTIRLVPVEPARAGKTAKLANPERIVL